MKACCRSFPPDTGKRLSSHSQIPKAALSHGYITNTHTKTQADAGLTWEHSHSAVVSSGQIRFNSPTPPPPHLHTPWVSLMIHSNTPECVRCAPSSVWRSPSVRADLICTAWTNGLSCTFNCLLIKLSFQFTVPTYFTLPILFLL